MTTANDPVSQDAREQQLRQFIDELQRRIHAVLWPSTPPVAMAALLASFLDVAERELQTNGERGRAVVQRMLANATARLAELPAAGGPVQ
jgi:hypothetical protein